MAVMVAAEGALGDNAPLPPDLATTYDFRVIVMGESVKMADISFRSVQFHRLDHVAEK